MSSLPQRFTRLPPPSPTMSYAYSPELLDLSATSGAPSAADKALKNHYQRLFVKDLWIIIASVVAALTFVRGVSLIITHPGPRPRQSVEEVHLWPRESYPTATDFLCYLNDFLQQGAFLRRKKSTLARLLREIEVGFLHPLP